MRVRERRVKGDEGFTYFDLKIVSGYVWVSPGLKKTRTRDSFSGLKDETKDSIDNVLVLKRALTTTGNYPITTLPMLDISPSTFNYLRLNPVLN